MGALSRRGRGADERRSVEGRWVSLCVSVRKGEAENKIRIFVGLRKRFACRKSSAISDALTFKGAWGIVTTPSLLHSHQSIKKKAERLTEPPSRHVLRLITK